MEHSPKASVQNDEESCKFLTSNHPKPVHIYRVEVIHGSGQSLSLMSAIKPIPRSLISVSTLGMSGTTSSGAPFADLESLAFFLRC